jgi:CBS domain-containing protein
MKVEDVMTTDVITVRPSALLKEVAGILVDRRISGVLVVADNGEVAGIVSEGDILVKEGGPSRRYGAHHWLLRTPAMQEQSKLEAGTAGEAMSAPPVTIGARRSLAEAARLMLGEGVNRLPVIEDGTLVGIVTRADLVRAFARPDEAIALEIREDVLQHVMWLSDPAAVTVRVDGGKVTLRGTVDSRSDAELVRTFAARVPGVVEVDSELTFLGDG